MSNSIQDACKDAWPALVLALSMACLPCRAAQADPPPAPVAPAPPPSATAASPEATPAPAPPLASAPPSPAQQRIARAATQRAALRHLAQDTEREATRQAHARQFDQAQGLYARAASVYHQQAKMARRAAQETAKAGQLTVAAAAHAEALAADKRYLACLSSQVSALRKGTAAEALLPPPSAPPAAKPLQPSAAKHLSPPVAKHLSPPVAKHLSPVPIHAYSARQAAHRARARRMLPPALKALRTAAAHLLRLSARVVAAQQRGLRQDALRRRKGFSAPGAEQAPADAQVAP